MGSHALPQTLMGSWPSWNRYVALIKKKVIIDILYKTLFIYSIISAEGVIIICLANLVTVATTLSMSAVSTNGIIEGGRQSSYCIALVVFRGQEGEGIALRFLYHLIVPSLALKYFEYKWSINIWNTSFYVHDKARGYFVTKILKETRWTYFIPVPELSNEHIYLT